MNCVCIIVSASRSL